MNDYKKQIEQLAYDYFGNSKIISCWLSRKRKMVEILGITVISSRHSFIYIKSHSNNKDFFENGDLDKSSSFQFLLGDNRLAKNKFICFLYVFQKLYKFRYHFSYQ